MNIFSKFAVQTSYSKIILWSVVFLMAFGNMSFFGNVVDVYPFNFKNSLFLISLVFSFGGFAVFLLSLACFKHTIKPVLITVLLISSSASYFMDSYNIVVDDTMIENIISTDVNESLDLLSLKMILYITFLGIIPSLLVYKANIVDKGVKKELISRAKLSLGSLTLVIAVIVIFGNFYASFFREHKSLRYYANPTFYIYSSIKFFKGQTIIANKPLIKIGMDAQAASTDQKRKLVIFVLGETARADRFSLNGYNKETNPLLKKENVINFSDFWACGTSTAASVPCIFSIFNQEDYSTSKASESENLLDVLKRTGVNQLWLDNNSDSKGVALRIPYQSYKTAETNPVCDVECRDIGMLSNLQSFIDEKKTGDIFIVLHQMGNHGPAYYKRYTKDFEKFTPICNTNQLEDCSKEEIGNTYDNVILYTDYFLSEVIGLLKKNDEDFQSAMLYVSDHGESLGENGLYLHGMPRFIAPDTQLHVPAVMWFSDSFVNPNIASLQGKQGNNYSHDNVFHTVLGLMEIETSVYDKKLDIINTN